MLSNTVLEAQKEQFILLNIKTENNTFYFQLENDIEKINQGISVGGIGLENMRKRLVLLYPDQHELQIENTENRFKVTLKNSFRKLMEKLNCIIIDDEPLGREVIESFVQEIPFLGLIKSYGDPTEALFYLQNNTVDIVFSDIQMPKINGMELVKSLSNPPVIILLQPIVILHWMVLIPSHRLSCKTGTF